MVVLSSAAHVWGDIDLDDPNWEHRPYDKWLAYAASKTANVLFAVDLTRRYGAQGVVANAVHPGRIGGTNLARYLGEDGMASLPAIAFLPIKDQSDPYANLQKSIPQGAATTVWAALDPQFAEVGGLYLADCKIAPHWHEEDPRRGVRQWALDAERARKLWEISEALVGIAAPEVR